MPSCRRYFPRSTGINSSYRIIRVRSKRCANGTIGVIINNDNDVSNKGIESRFAPPLIADIRSWAARTAMITHSQAGWLATIPACHRNTRDHGDADAPRACLNHPRHFPLFVQPFEPAQNHAPLPPWPHEFEFLHHYLSEQADRIQTSLR